MGSRGGGSRSGKETSHPSYEHHALGERPSPELSPQGLPYFTGLSRNKSEQWEEAKHWKPQVPLWQEE